MSRTTTTIAEPKAPAASSDRPTAVLVPQFPDRRFVVRDFGARGDGVTNDSAAIMRAIDACTAAGGGTVAFPAGTYMAASVRLKSHVRLQLEAGATLKALAQGYEPPEPNPFDRYQDFGHSHFRNALLYGENLIDVAIEGPGTIDGSGLRGGDAPVGGGDKQISLKSSERILFRDLNQVKGGHFFYLLTDCKHVTMTRLTMRKGRDGIDLVGTSHVDLSETTIHECHDDTIALKADYSVGKRLLTENVRVWNATVESGCNGLQFGSETAGDFRNVRFTNIQILRAGKAGIGIQSNDGGIIEDVAFENITIRGAANPIFINTTKRLRAPDVTAPGRVRNIRLRNITATEVVPSHGREPANAATISGLPDVPHEEILFENVSLTYKGGGTRADGELQASYSQKYNPRELGPRPAYGFFCRHVKNLTFRNVKVGFESEDLRPAWVALDVDGLVLDGVSAQRAGAKAWPSLKVEKVRSLTVTRSAPLPTMNAAAVETGSY